MISHSLALLLEINVKSKCISCGRRIHAVIHTCRNGRTAYLRGETIVAEIGEGVLRREINTQVLDTRYLRHIVSQLHILDTDERSIFHVERVALHREGRVEGLRRRIIGLRVGGRPSVLVVVEVVVGVREHTAVHTLLVQNLVSYIGCERDGEVEALDVEAEVETEHQRRNSATEIGLILLVDHLVAILVFVFEVSGIFDDLREQFFPYFWNKIMQKEIISSEPFTIWEKYVPLFRYYRNLDRHDIKGLLTSTARRQVKGYQGKDKQWDGTEFRKIEIARYAETEKAIKLFDEYLAKAREEGIKIILVYTPIYIGVTQKLDHPEKMHARYQEFADRYNIPILDYSDMEICNDTTYFYNAMHLNKLGAEIFSDSLANDIKRLEEDGLLK